MRLIRPRQPASPTARRAHAEPRPTSTPGASAPEGEPPQPEAGQAPIDPDAGALAAERRLRAAGGPTDAETYACRCGAVFPAPPTTSVSCPLCGVHQAW